MHIYTKEASQNSHASSEPGSQGTICIISKTVQYKFFTSSWALALEEWLWAELALVPWALALGHSSDELAVGNSWALLSASIKHVHTVAKILHSLWPALFGAEG